MIDPVTADDIDNWETIYSVQKLIGEWYIVHLKLCSFVRYHSVTSAYYPQRRVIIMKSETTLVRWLEQLRLWPPRV